MVAVNSVFCFASDSLDVFLQINKEASISIQGNWSFFAQLNVWNFLDKSELRLFFILV